MSGKGLCLRHKARKPRVDSYGRCAAGEKTNTLQKLDERIEAIEEETTTNGIY